MRGDVTPDQLRQVGQLALAVTYRRSACRGRSVFVACFECLLLFACCDPPSQFGCAATGLIERLNQRSALVGGECRMFVTVSRGASNGAVTSNWLVTAAYLPSPTQSCSNATPWRRRDATASSRTRSPAGSKNAPDWSPPLTTSGPATPCAYGNWTASADPSKTSSPSPTTCTAAASSYVSSPDGSPAPTRPLVKANSSLP